MHARIYFLTSILLAVIIGTFTNDKVSKLSAENQWLRQSLDKEKNAVVSEHPSALEPFIVRHSFSPAASELPILFTDEPGNKVELKRALDSYREKVDLMESRLERYRDEAMGYQMMIDALKNEVNLKDGELRELRSTMAESQAKNRVLIKDLAQKERDLDETLASLNNKEKEAAFEKKLQRLSQNLRFAEADACYARAQLTEAAADKIRFSPARKKEYLMEALEGYKKAFSLGKHEATQNISMLQKSLFPKFPSAP